MNLPQTKFKSPKQKGDLYPELELLIQESKLSQNSMYLNLIYILLILYIVLLYKMVWHL